MLFAILPQAKGDEPDYLMVHWEETCYRAGPKVDWLEYGKRFTLWFREQPLQLIRAKSPETVFQPADYFSIDKLSFFVQGSKITDLRYFEIEKGQPLPTVCQGDQL